MVEIIIVLKTDDLNIIAEMNDELVDTYQDIECDERLENLLERCKPVMEKIKQALINARI